MSTLVYRQPSKPSMDSSHFVESATMKLKLVSPKPYNPKTIFESGWNLLQSPSSHNSIDSYFKTKENPYVHKEKSLKLSEKSLQLCTESLGSETGSDKSEDVDAIFALPFPTTKRSRKDQLETNKVSKTRSFPPPLTTKPFQVRSHREGGRLIIEAVEMSLGINYGCLRVERSDGRLRLTCCKNNYNYNYDYDCDYDYDYDYDVEMDEEESERNVFVENFQRLRRCNEDENGDIGMCCNWEPCCWVATS